MPALQQQNGDDKPEGCLQAQRGSNVQGLTAPYTRPSPAISTAISFLGSEKVREIETLFCLSFLPQGPAHALVDGGAV